MTKLPTDIPGLGDWKNQMQTQNASDDLNQRIQKEQDRDRIIDVVFRFTYIALGAFVVIWFVLSLLWLPGCGGTGEYPPEIVKDASVDAKPAADLGCFGPIGTFKAKAKLLTGTCQNPGDGPVSDPFVVEAGKPRLACGEYESDPEYKEVDGCLITTFKTITVSEKEYGAKIGLIADCVVWQCYVIWNLTFEES